ncbi:hypothetical protein ACWCQ0_48785, partial [Streptomyces massasporeus]
VRNLVTSVRQPGVDAATELNNFVDQALPTLRGSAPASWGSVGTDDGVPVAGLVILGAVVAAGGAGAYTVVRRNRLRKEAEERAALDKLRVVVDEDITAFGEELERLDFHPAEAGADDAMRGDYERSLDSYDKAKSLMASAARPHDVRAVTEALEDGRYSLAVLAARRESRPLPERRAPCFFDPRHGPSTEDRDAKTAEHKRRAAELVDIVKDCIRRHTQLQSRLLDAGPLFRAEQDRQAFAAPTSYTGLDLYGQLVAPTLPLPVEQAAKVTDAFFAHGTGLRTPASVRLGDLVDLLLTPPVEREHLGAEMPEPDLARSAAATYSSWTARCRVPTSRSSSTVWRSPGRTPRPSPSCPAPTCSPSAST